MNILMALSIVSKVYIDEKKNQLFTELLETSISLTIETLILAQIAATYEAITATTTVALINKHRLKG